MTKELQFIQYKNSAVRYLTFGEGEELLIALHGFADGGAAMFSVFEKELGSKYTLFAIDLPYHKETLWKETYYTREDIQQLIQKILEMQGKEKFSLLGYSMGGRICLKLLPHFATQIDELFLIASDGLPEGKIIHAHMMPLWFRKMVARTLKNPNWLVKLVASLRKWKLIPQLYQDFIRANVANERRRKRVMNTWISLYDFRISIRKTRTLLNESKIPVVLIFGKRDQIILEKYGQRFKKGLNQAKLYTIDASHKMITPKLVEKIIEIDKNET